MKAASLHPQALLDALHAGQFCSSTGPNIRDIRCEASNQLTVACSPCRSIFIAGQGAWSRYQHGRDLADATFVLEGCASPYLRVTVEDASGRRAWSNPIWL